jgi:hypothetical protein
MIFRIDGQIEGFERYGIRLLSPDQYLPLTSFASGELKQ